MQPPAVLPGVALLADARAVDAVALPRAVAGAPQLGAILPGETLLADALAVHAEPVGAAASRAAELGAVLAPVVVVADALALQADAAAGASPGAAGLGAVAARPALHAHAAAGLQAEVPMAAALRGVIQLPCKDAGPRVRAHQAGGGKRAAFAPGQPVDGLWGRGGRCRAGRGWSFLWLSTSSSGEMVALGLTGAELVIWAHGGAWLGPQEFICPLRSTGLHGYGWYQPCWGAGSPFGFSSAQCSDDGNLPRPFTGKKPSLASPLHQP